MLARWPTSESVDEVLSKESSYFNEMSHDVRVRMKKMIELREKKGLKVPHPEYAVVYVTDQYLPWQTLVLTTLQRLYNKETNELPENVVILNELKGHPELKPVFKKVMPFVQSVKANLAVKGAESLDVKVPFDERATLERNLGYLTRSLELKEVWIENACNSTEAKIKDDCMPGKPISVFSNTPLKTFVTLTAANPQKCSGCFSTRILVFDGDESSRLVDRVKRWAQIPGGSRVSLWRYLGDSRSIPVTGEETKGLELIPSTASISVRESKAWLNLPGADPVPLGTQFCYLVCNNNSNQ
jgi:leucyl-tRNA synthetase